MISTFQGILFVTTDGELSVAFSRCTQQQDFQTFLLLGLSSKLTHSSNVEETYTTTNQTTHLHFRLADKELILPT